MATPMVTMALGATPVAATSVAATSLNKVNVSIKVNSVGYVTKFVVIFFVL
jgi:hypothetical protein